MRITIITIIILLLLVLRGWFLIKKIHMKPFSVLDGKFFIKSTTKSTIFKGAQINDKVTQIHCKKNVQSIKKTDLLILQKLNANL